MLSDQRLTMQSLQHSYQSGDAYRLKYSNCMSCIKLGGMGEGQNDSSYSDHNLLQAASLVRY